MRTSLFALLILCSFSSTAQDLLISKGGDTTKAVVVAVYFDNIHYRKYGDPNGPVLTASKYELSEIIYMSGSIDDFTKFAKPATNDTVTTIGLDSSQIYYASGTKDAFRYYKGYKPASTTVYVTTTVFLPLGLIIASMSLGDEPIDACELPDENLLINSYYIDGYTAGAKKRKAHRIWSNFFYGFGTAFVAGLVVVYTQK